MSVRAYRFIEIKTEEKSSFNLFHDWKLKDFLDKEADFYGYLNSGGTGITEVPVKVLARALRMAAKLGLSETTVRRLEQDIQPSSLPEISLLPITATNYGDVLNCLECWDAAVNKFTAEFIRDFCFADGSIDWEKLVRFVSEDRASRSVETP